MVSHPWHELSTGKNPPGQLNAVIEIPRGSRAKYEVDKESGLIKLDRVIYASMYYPLNYGFIPRTLGADNDPLDIVVLTQVSVVPLCIIPCRVIGLMRMIDRGENDDKIIAVAEDDASVNHITDITQLPPYFNTELKHFFENYKTLENRKVIVNDFLPRAEAHQVVEQSLLYYRQTFGSAVHS
ncbi:MAG: inorganic pyrophosphatase [Cyclobacteriaceae bacterium]|nr:MAG: inorganic pyrophosphatase [Cyclobacteriaceae bacterium]